MEATSDPGRHVLRAFPGQLACMRLKGVPLKRGAPSSNLKEKEMRKFVIDNGGRILIVTAEDMDAAAREHLENRYHGSSSVSPRDPLTYSKMEKSPFGDEMIEASRYCHWYDYSFSVRAYVEEIDGAQKHPEMIRNELMSAINILKGVAEKVSDPEVLSEVESFLGAVFANKSLKGDDNA